MKYLKHALATCIWNTWNIQKKHLQHKTTYCNIRLKQLKYLEHTVATYVWNMCNIQKNNCNIRLETDETFWTNTCNICNIPQTTFATSRWNNYNIHLKRLKHLKYTCATGKAGSVDSGHRGMSRWRATMCEHHQHRSRSWVPLARPGKT
jgi:hypothetical protein